MGATRLRSMSVQALLGIAALLLQLALPGLHAQHVAPDGSRDGAAHQVVAHDALACAMCAAIAHGRASALDAVPALPVATLALAIVTAPAARLHAAPAPTGAVPRGPPARG